ncbi:branched-chain amino acid ABC transporter permease [Hoeflea alexandrii]|uniref:branched-chain amino acid ABC transporter permease n=1 Tax=Hoeflea alexandrii TaxID=288436 RepID=UPI0022B00952|nr:branched-chain amino acid ABC transporter permease [Hoeflea alexandrii]MCZ4291658.1 branched-chain amino acid ABC transporter permease [Hoeflea alexandrii]
MTSLIVSDLIQIVMTTLTVGSMYALIAVGVSLIYSATGVINFAQGEFVMLSGMTVASLYGSMGWPLTTAIAVALVVVLFYAALLTLLTSILAARISLIGVLIITIGASIATQGIAARIWDSDTHRFAPFSGEDPIRILDATISPQALWIVGVTAICIAGLIWFMRSTMAGKAMRACSLDQAAATMVGIPVKATVLLSFTLSGLLGAVGGILTTPLTTIDANSGMLLAIKGFTAAMLGGMGSIPGALFGALLIAFVETVTVTVGSSAFKELPTFTIIILVLLFLPRGLVGGRNEIGLQHEDLTRQ